MAKMVKCKTCGANIARSAKTCPQCGGKNKKKHPILGGFLVFVILIGVIGSMGSDETSDAGKDVPTNQIENTTQDTQKPATTVDNAPSETPSPSEEPTSSETIGQKNALRAAKSYLSAMAFSYEGLISQLEFEKYSHEDAAYAADNCGADWNEQALKSAKHYLSTMPFSYTGLIRQLEFEKYTTAQATYGADNCGADWMEQAVKSAKHYLDTMPFSRDSLISQLEFEGFTHEQAVHGAEQNGY